ncbi:MAG: hypothetical protein J3K34DRAFT_435387 [Monoraphidium minutum]|nr:MAG: hypothetical protein J3K34DRAFT_435387 [Monoraphidium minutum]
MLLLLRGLLGGLLLLLLHLRPVNVLLLLLLGRRAPRRHVCCGAGRRLGLAGRPGVALATLWTRLAPPGEHLHGCKGRHRTIGLLISD